MFCIRRLVTDLLVSAALHQLRPASGLAVSTGSGGETTELIGAGCEEDAAGAICFGDFQEQVLLPPALPAGVVGMWNFDESMPLDYSGYNNHGLASVQAGPTFAGQGSSAHFFKTNYLVVRGSESLKLQDFTYTFWMHILDDVSAAHQGLRVCPLLRKGSADGRVEDGNTPLPPAPAIFIDRQTRHLRIEIGTVGGTPGLMTNLGTEGFDSNARLSHGRWYHVAVVRMNGQRRTRLYVNGVLDASQSTAGFTAPNAGPLYVGGDPSTGDQCNIPMYVDELKIYNRPLSHDEIQAEASPALAGVEPAFLRLACTDCPLEVAMQNCPDTYHICNSLELHMGAYQVARALGYLKHGGHVWSHYTTVQPGTTMDKVSKSMAITPQQVAPAPSPGAEAAGPQLGLGLCCADIA
jgi:hypothetical protein